MQYPVLLHRDGTGRYEAVSLTVPLCAGKGENRNEALMDLKRLLQNWLHSAEMTTIEVDTPVIERNFASLPSSESQGSSNNPWML